MPGNLKVAMDLGELAIFTARLEERITGTRELMDEREKRAEERSAAIRATQEKSEEGQEKLNQKANEFRGALDDAAKLAANTQATKAELAALKDLVLTHATQNEVDRLLDRITTLERANAGAGGRLVGTAASTDFVFKTLPLLIAAAALAASIWIRTGGP